MTKLTSEFNWEFLLAKPLPIILRVDNLQLTNLNRRKIYSEVIKEKKSPRIQIWIWFKQIDK